MLRYKGQIVTIDGTGPFPALQIKMPDGTTQIVNAADVVPVQLIGYEILNHGVQHEQYFQGCGCAYTPYDHVVTGCAGNASDAYQDALESIAQQWDAVVADQFPKRPHGISAREKVSAKFGEDCHCYVSIRYNLSGV